MRNGHILFDMHLSNSVADEFGKVYLARDLEQRTAALKKQNNLQ